MRVLIVGEGKHEEHGALTTLSVRLNPGIRETTFDRVKNRDRRLHHGKGGGVFRLAVSWLIEANNRRFDALVLVLDKDVYPDRRRQVDEAQACRMGIPRRALGIAIKSFDAWMLADERALTNVLGTPINRQAEPERSSNPKAACRALLGESPVEMSQAQMYAAIAECADLGTIETRCPVGFARFAERVRQL